MFCKGSLEAINAGGRDTIAHIEVCIPPPRTEITRVGDLLIACGAFTAVKAIAVVSPGIGALYGATSGEIPFQTYDHCVIDDGIEVCDVPHLSEAWVQSVQRPVLEQIAGL